MNCTDIINQIDNTYTLYWDTDAILNILTTYINKETDFTHFKLHCLEIAATDLRLMLNTEQGKDYDSTLPAPKR